MTREIQVETMLGLGWTFRSLAGNPLGTRDSVVAAIIADGDVRVEWPPSPDGSILLSQLTCDFCSLPNVPLVKMVPARNVVVGEDERGRPVKLGVAWAACQSCAEIIDRGLFPALLDRAAIFFSIKHNLPKFAFQSVKAEIRSGWLEAFGDMMKGI